MSSGFRRAPEGGAARSSLAAPIAINWIDTLRREGNQWKVSFQAFARPPCAQ